MSLILCPECGTKISDRATKCPHCGFQSADAERPISEQDKYEIVPIFEYDIEEWKPNRAGLSVISYEDNKSLIEYFGSWETIRSSAATDKGYAICDRGHKNLMWHKGNSNGR